MLKNALRGRGFVTLALMAVGLGGSAQAVPFFFMDDGPPIAEGADLVVSGLVFEFGGAGRPVKEARVCVLEPPNRGCVTADRDGHYRYPIRLLPDEPTPVTVVLGELRYHTMRAPTLMLDHDTDPGSPTLHTWHLQSVVNALFIAYREAVLNAAREQLKLDQCQVAGTVADQAKALHYQLDDSGHLLRVDYEGFLEDTVHGFAGARVRLMAEDPTSPSGWTEVLGHGPVYTNDRVLPVPPSTLSLTSGDGGFFFYNLDLGQYRIDVEDTQAGHSAGRPVEFSGPIYINCERDPEFKLPGVFVNVAPPSLHAKEAVPMYPRPEVQPLHLPELPRLPDLPTLDALQAREERRQERREARRED